MCDREGTAGSPAPPWKHFVFHDATFPCSLALLWAIFWLTGLTNVVIWICSLTQTCLPSILIQNEEAWNNLMDLRRTSLILPHFPFGPQGPQTQAFSTDAGQRGLFSLLRRQKLKDLSWKRNWYHLYPQISLQEVYYWKYLSFLELIGFLSLDFS